MSRIEEALVFKTDEERLEWFRSLSPSEQAEIQAEAKEIIDRFIEEFSPIAEAFERWFSPWINQVDEKLEKVGAVFAKESDESAGSENSAGN